MLELRKHAPEVFDKLEVYIDGGVRRGTDVVKALCLGAKGVGLGRPFLYALAYGEEGVVHAVESEWSALRPFASILPCIHVSPSMERAAVDDCLSAWASRAVLMEVLREEISSTMRLLGCTRLDQLGPHLLNTKAIDPLLNDRLEYGPREEIHPRL